jgi:hypothetical protein
MLLSTVLESFGAVIGLVVDRRRPSIEQKKNEAQRVAVDGLIV